MQVLISPNFDPSDDIFMLQIGYAQTSHIVISDAPSSA